MQKPFEVNTEWVKRSWAESICKENTYNNKFNKNDMEKNPAGVALVSLLLTLNIFHTLFYCFYC